MNESFGSVADCAGTLDGGRTMSKVKVVEPIEGLAFLSLQTEDKNMIDIPLSYKQDITGPFIQEFKEYLSGKKGDRHLVLSVDGEEGKFIVIANDDLSYVIDERTKKLYVCTADAKDIIRGCIRNFVAYMDAWANFDIEENGGANQINYMRDFLDRKALIESAEDEINPYLMGPKI